MTETRENFKNVTSEDFALWATSKVKGIGVLAGNFMLSD
jgi:hypothetical protein